MKKINYEHHYLLKFEGDVDNEFNSLTIHSTDKILTRKQFMEEVDKSPKGGKFIITSYCKFILD